jgi:hypothetical protein
VQQLVAVAPLKACMVPRSRAGTPRLTPSLAYQGYLRAKEERMDHLLAGQYCHWDHSGEPSQPTPTTSQNGGMGLPAAMNSLAEATLKPHRAEGGQQL